MSMLRATYEVAFSGSTVKFRLFLRCGYICPAARRGVTDSAYQIKWFLRQDRSTREKSRYLQGLFEIHEEKLDWGSLAFFRDN